MNPSNVGQVEYTVRIDTTKLRSDAKATEAIIKSTSNTLEDEARGSERRVGKALSGVVSKIRAAVIATTAAVTAATTAVATLGIKSAADFEQTRIGLENMLGSADKARSLLSDISKFAADTPFEFPELAQATRQLVAFGFSGEDAFDTMKQLGDVSAAVGAPINDLAYLMGTLRTQGRAFTIDIRQFAQRGIPIYEYLAKVLGKSEKAISTMIEEGEIGFPEVQKAFRAMTSEGGKFYKTMDRQSKSLSGQFSTLKDNLGQTLRELVGISKTGDIIKGSLFDKISNGIGDINKNLPRLTQSFKNFVDSISPGLSQFSKDAIKVGRDIIEYLLPKFETLWKTINETLIPTVGSLISAFGPEVGKGLIWVIGAAVDAANFFIEFFAPLFKFLSDNEWIVWGLVGALAAVKGALFIDSAAKGFVASLALADAAVATTTGKMGKLSGAMALLRNPVVITLSIVGAALVVQGVKQIKGAIDEISRGIDDLNKKKVEVKTSAGNIQVSGGSGVGLVQQLRNAFSGFRASGGPVSAGQSYVVGERQPELFVPNTDGYILPEVPELNGGGGTTSITLNLSGVMASSRSDLRAVAKDLIKAIDEEITAKGGKPIMGVA